MIRGILLKYMKPVSSVVSEWIDLTPYLSTYDVSKKTTYETTFVTITGEEVRVGKKERTQLSFSLIPLTGEEYGTFYEELRGRNGRVTFVYTDPLLNTEVAGDFWLDSDPFQQYALRSVDNQTRYKPGEFVYTSTFARTYASPLRDEGYIDGTPASDVLGE